MRLSVFVLLGIAANAVGDHPTPTAPTGLPVPLYADLGDLHHTITTADPQAQAYFDQGLRLVYGFNHAEAVRSFEEALRRDPSCAMAHWGIALALGPNYNMPVEPDAARQALEHLRKAEGLSEGASPSEKALIAALSRRFSDDPAAERNQLDRDYADAMRKVATDFPDDADALTLFADALMNLRPWELWTKDGQPQPGTEEIVATLEAALRRFPRHPGAHHLYIHAVEASANPERGIPSAEVLGSLMPGVGHMVHMPAHIFLRVGRYADAVTVNQRAIEVDRKYIAEQKPTGPYPMMYYPHNIDFMWSALCMEGRSAEALRAADAVLEAVGEPMIRQMPMLEGMSTKRLETLVRFGRWREVLAEPKPPSDFQYTTGIWHYAMGRAYAAQGESSKGLEHLTALRQLHQEVAADKKVMRHSVQHLLGLAADVLEGDIAARNGDTPAAITALRRAIQAEDTLSYDEPPAWYYSVRHTLGRVLLDGGRPAESEAILREDLRLHPHNGWALAGLLQSLRLQGKTEEIESIEQQWRNAWQRADVPIRASDF